MMGIFLYSIVAGALVMLACYAVDQICRLAGKTRRWTWAAGMLLTLGLVFSAVVLPGLRAEQQAVNSGDGVHGLAANGVSGADGMLSLVGGSGLLQQFRLQMVSGITGATTLLERFFPFVTASTMVAGWVVVSLSLLLFLMYVLLRYARSRRLWPRILLRRATVRLSPSAGPAVLGLYRPEIVVPRWLLSRSVAEQDLVITHENEHVAARDPLLLAIGWCCVIAMPWNPAVWWMLSRLRLAVEYDCDARVLRSGATRQAYGSLLLDLGAQLSGLPAGATALADRTTDLERRLLAMKPYRPSFVPARATILTLAAIVAVIAACDMSVPTAAAVEQATASSAESIAREIQLVAADDSTPVFVVDGQVVSEKAAKLINAGDIATVEIRGRQGAMSSAEIHIVTHDGISEKKQVLVEDMIEPQDRLLVERKEMLRVKQQDSLKVLRSEEARPHIVRETLPKEVAAIELKEKQAAVKHSPYVLREIRTDTGAATLQEKREDSNRLTGGGSGILYIVDGVVMGESFALTKDAISAMDIESIEVIKGAAATKLYGSRAANGVISIKTKR